MESEALGKGVLKMAPVLPLLGLLRRGGAGVALLGLTAAAPRWARSNARLAQGAGDQPRAAVWSRS